MDSTYDPPPPWQVLAEEDDLHRLLHNLHRRLAITGVRILIFSPVVHLDAHQFTYVLPLLCVVAPDTVVVRRDHREHQVVIASEDRVSPYQLQPCFELWSEVVREGHVEILEHS